MRFDTDALYNNKIDRPEEHKIETEELAFLKNSIVRGNISDEDLRIFILDEVYDHVERYSKTDLKRELGGVFLGSYIRKDDYEVVIINGVLDAKHTKQTSTAMEYTERTWEAIHKEMDIYYPDSEIVGWFHTCPGYGVFLSSDDPFIQNNFSDFLWHTAWIIDPVSDNQELFIRRNKSIEKCSGYYIYSKTKSLTEEVYPRMQRQTQSTEATTNRRQVQSGEENHNSPIDIRVKESPNKILYIVNAVLLILVIVLAINQINIGKKYKELENIVVSPTSGNSSVVEEQGKVIEALEERVAELENQYNEVLAQVVVPDNDASSGSNSGTTDEKPGNNSNFKNIEYEVQKGETLWRISTKFYNDGQKYRLILEANGMKEGDTVKAGQKIIIPILDE